MADEPRSPGVELDDDTLIGRARQQDQYAFAELVRRYSAAAHRTAALMTAPDEVEDAVQDAFVRAYYALPNFRAEAPFRPWLLAIVANCARNRNRSTMRQVSITKRKLMLDAPAELAASVDSTVFSLDSRQRLLDAIMALPEKHRLIVTCRYLLELSESETAQILGLRLGTVKSRLSRALGRLRVKLADLEVCG
jgi:RNA polymerase sigma-70 factor (ECF subfamily)